MQYYFSLWRGHIKAVQPRKATVISPHSANPVGWRHPPTSWAVTDVISMKSLLSSKSHGAAVSQRQHLNCAGVTAVCAVLRYMFLWHYQAQTPESECSAEWTPGARFECQWSLSNTKTTPATGKVRPGWGCAEGMGLVVVVVRW
jgi:hypothetical protein